MRIPKKLLALLLVLLLALPVVPAFAESAEPVSMDLPLYVFRSTNVRTVPVVFFNGCMDIPYCSVETVSNLLYYFSDANYNVENGYCTFRELEDANMLSVGPDQDPDVEVFYILRENGSFVLFDYTDDMIWINDRDLFHVSSYAVSGGDLVSADGLFYGDEANNSNHSSVNLYERVNSDSFKREGEVTCIFLNDYNIALELYDNAYYVPLATVSDLLLQYPITFNGEALFAINGSLEQNTPNDEDLTQYDLYYRPGARERSEELAVFTYNELCLMLDNNYGLMNEHGITNFNEYFNATGLAFGLSSTDAEVFTNTLNQLIYGYFGDLHSSLVSVTPYSGGTVDVKKSNTSISVTEDSKMYWRFADAREAAGITSNYQIIDGYTEIGDTAFVTFDKFRSASQNYYDTSLYPNFGDIYMSDTISLVVYAHDRIHRENSPIRKVVIDLSCNTGGELDACVFIAAWVLGSANISIENVKTGAQYTTSYWTDTNLNGVCYYDDELGVDNLDVYCLVNGVSFSCGNLLPTLFKQDGRVTLIGQTTGGGACLVRNTSAADGTLFNISDYYRLAIVKNGSFYNIDRGVEADIPLRKVASFYDRAALAEYLDTIR